MATATKPAVKQSAAKPATTKTVIKPATKPVEKPAAKSVAKHVSKIAANIAAKAAAKEALKARQAEQETLSESALVALTMIRTFSPPVQPVQAPEPAPVNTAYKYKVGDAVYFTSPSFGRAAASGAYTVIKVLPSDGEDRQYRIKSSVEAFERVAKESQLERI